MSETPEKEPLEQEPESQVAETPSDLTDPNQSEALDELVSATENPYEDGEVEIDDEPEDTHAQEGEQTEPAAKATDAGDDVKKMKYAYGQIQRKFGSLESKFDSLLTELKSLKATPERKEAVEQVVQAKDELDELMDGLPDDEFVTTSQVRKLINRVKSVEKSAIERAEAAAKLARESVLPVREEIDRQRSQLDRQRFAEQNPDIAPQYDALIQSAREALNAELSDVPEDQRSAVLVRKLATPIWRQVVAEAKKKALSVKAETGKPEAQAKPVNGKPAARTNTGAVTPSRTNPNSRLEKLALELEAAFNAE